MIDLDTALLFVATVLVLLLSPGPNMAFVLAHGVTYGVRGGLAAALGISLADVIMTLLTALGVTAIVAAWPPSFDVLRYLGAAYFLWLAIKMVRAPGPAALPERTQPSLRKVLARAAAGSLLNPKALLFYMVFLPQFVDAGRGQIALQIASLGLILTLVAFLFHAALSLFAGEIGRFLHLHARAAAAQRWLLGSVLALLALRLFVMERPVQG